LNDINHRLASEVRFLSKVQKTEGCWEWQARREPFGHGSFYFQGRMVKAHRVAWMLFRGEIPEGMCVLHHCDNPPCVNPEHLYIGTKADNHADMVKRGRKRRGKGVYNSTNMTRGEKHPSAKLTEELVRKLRDDYYLGGGSFLGLAKLYGCSYNASKSAILGLTWKHVLFTKEQKEAASGCK